MQPCVKFAHAELDCNSHVPVSGNDSDLAVLHNFRMAKPRHREEGKPGWFVAEWLEYLNMQQTDLIDATGRSKGRISELVTGKQRFNEDDLLAFSKALEVRRGFLLDVNPLTSDPLLLQAGTWRLPAPRSASQAKKRA